MSYSRIQDSASPQLLDLESSSLSLSHLNDDDDDDDDDDDYDDYDDNEGGGGGGRRVII